MSKDPEKGIVNVRVENTAELGQKKSCNLPYTHVDLPPLTERDEKDLEFGAKNEVRRVWMGVCVCVCVWRGVMNATGCAWDGWLGGRGIMYKFLSSL